VVERDSGSQSGSSAGGDGEFGEHVPGPPWILGHRGTPNEAPENTLSGMRRAVAIGLDGFEYDLRACATGEEVLIHDVRVDRTTDGTGSLGALSLPELSELDAGAWFGKRFRGERLPVFHEVIEVPGGPERGWPMHMIELKERGLVAGIAARLAESAPQLSVRVASFLRDVVLDARDHDLPTMLLAVSATEEDRRFVRDERITAYGTGPSGWRTPGGGADWSFCERWAWAVDEPADLLEACRAPLFGFNTNEPYRALATRALAHLAPDDDGEFPVRAPMLIVEPEALSEADRRRGEWYGAWRKTAAVRNPFPFPVDVACSIFVRNGAFEVEGLPHACRLEPGAVVELPFQLTGGSRSPGDDPLLAVQFRWQAGPGRRRGRLLLDAPMHRVRCVSADPIARRVTLLAERQGDAPASMTIRRHGRHLVVGIENPGGIEHPHTIAHLAGETVRGGRGLRLTLPDDFDTCSEGVPFSLGIEGKLQGERVVRRFAGGIPEGAKQGVPGRLLPL